MTFKLSLIGTKVPKVCQKNPPPLHHQHQPEPLRQGRMDPCFHVLYQILTLPSECRSRNRDSSDQATFFQSSIVQFWWVCVNCILCFCSYLSGAAPGVVFCCWSHLLQGSTCCVFRDGSAYLVVKWLLSYCCLSIILTSLPFSSDINKAFCPHNWRSLDISLFWTILCKPRDGCVWKSQ